MDNFPWKPYLVITELTVEHLTPGSDDLVELLEDLPGVRELKITGSVSKVSAGERGFWTSCFRSGSSGFAAESLYEGYMEGWTANKVTLADLPSLKTLYLTNRTEDQPKDRVLTRASSSTI
jgi:hypothetical protein